jgi:hypothetical protein
MGFYAPFVRGVFSEPEGLEPLTPLVSMPFVCPTSKGLSIPETESPSKSGNRPCV